MSKAQLAQCVWVVEFSQAGCEILDENRTLIATGTRVGNLFYLNCRKNLQRMNAVAGNNLLRARKASGTDALVTWDHRA